MQGHLCRVVSADGISQVNFRRLLPTGDLRNPSPAWYRSETGWAGSKCDTILAISATSIYGIRRPENFALSRGATVRSHL